MELPANRQQAFLPFKSMVYVRVAIGMRLA
jgi:hypothetical protein